MAQTDARPGFRLPWNSERSTSEQTEIDENGQTGIADGETGWPTSSQAVATDAPDAPVADVDTTTETDTEAEASVEVTPVVPAETTPVTPGRRKPTKFMEDLSKAMQAAAEEARTQTLAQFEADAKGHIENIQGRLTTETADLRRKADDDVAAHREWSKLEIARVREETEGKISARKTQLESEIALHAAQIEREVQVVQGRVSEFEAEMASFFERLLAEDDPTRIASMAERLPEPPPFDTVTEMAAALTETVPDEVAEEIADEVADEVADATVVEGTVADEQAGTESTESAESTEEPTVGEVETVSAEDDGTPTADGHDSVVPEGFEMDREAAFAAVQAAAEAAASAEVATDAANRAEAVAEITMGMGGSHHDGATGEDAPEPDFGAAEVEAAAAADGDNGEITEIGDDDLAARLAGLVPAAGKSSSKAQSTESASTQVVVVGLVSVASIASFKRHLGRVSGVQSVGVSSGPDGEFVFAVHHSADVVLRDAIPSLPSFQARVTNAADGVLNVTAHDPESDPK
jgi:hypothetical protein